MKEGKSVDWSGKFQGIQIFTVSNHHKLGRHKAAKQRNIIMISCFCCSVAKSCPTLWPHGLQPNRLPCPSTITWRLLILMPIELVMLLTISFSVAPFSSCPQSLPASIFFPMSWLFASRGQSIGTSVSASVLLMNIQGWCPLVLTGWISL